MAFGSGWRWFLVLLPWHFGVWLLKNHLQCLPTMPKNYPAPMGWEDGRTMLIAALLTMAKTWKQPKCPSMDEWISKMWFRHTMQHYSALKRRKFC